MRVSTTRGGGSSRRIWSEVARFDKFLTRWADVLGDRYGAEAAEVMKREMLEEMWRLAPELPDVGGRGNPFARNLVQAAWALASYRVVVKHGGDLEDAGELIHRLIRAEVERVPTVLRPWMKWYVLGMPGRWKKAARRSQARRYPDDWVFEFVEDAGEVFDLGIDIVECAIVKFLHAQGADELAPYCCDVDYVQAEVLGYGLRRTKTLAWDCDKCDFRFTMDGSTSAPWPPRFVERNCRPTDSVQPEAETAQ